MNVQTACNHTHCRVHRALAHVECRTIITGLTSIRAMSSASSHNRDEIPGIWLLPPEALQPPPDPIRPIPIAINATLVTLIFLILKILYSTKPRGSSAERRTSELEDLKASIRVIRPASAAPPSISCTTKHHPSGLPTSAYTPAMPRAITFILTDREWKRHDQRTSCQSLS